MNDYLNFKGSHFLNASDTGDGSVCRQKSSEMIQSVSGDKNAETSEKKERKWNISYNAQRNK